MQATFGIDTSITSVSAADKSTGRKTQINITNNKGCFSKDDIDQTVKEAEK